MDNCRPVHEKSHRCRNRRGLFLLVLGFLSPSHHRFTNPQGTVKTTTLSSRAPSPVTASANSREPLPRPKFFELASIAAKSQHMSTMDYLRAIKSRAAEFMKKGGIVDRVAFTEALKQEMLLPGRFTLVLGGKSLGKTFVRNLTSRQLERAANSTLTVLDVNMRDVPGSTLFQALTKRARSLSRNRAKFFAKEIFSVLGAVFGSTSSLFQSLGDLVSKVSAERQQESLTHFIEEVEANGNVTCIIVDEANLALPGSGGQDAAKEALGYLVGVSKEKQLASVVLLSSDYAYPYRLAEAGLKLEDISMVIVIPEIPEVDMIDLLVNTWGMNQDLSQEFFRYFGGHIHQSFKAVLQILADGQSFNPLSLLDCPGLASCLENPDSRAHLEQIVLQGFSPVKNIKSDKGAELIVEMDIGGIIREGTQTVGQSSNMWGDGSYDYVLIPTCTLMRLKLAARLQLGVVVASTQQLP